MVRAAERPGIANQYQPTPRPRDGDAQPPRVATEAQIADAVGAGGGEHDEVRLLALERVHCADAAGGPLPPDEVHLARVGSAAKFVLFLFAGTRLQE